MKRSLVFSSCILYLFVSLQCSLYALDAPSGLMCELLANPKVTTISDSTPEFSWIVNSDIDGDYQTAYQVMLASSSALLQQGTPDLWDSAKVTSNISVNVPYAGASLSTNTTYFWQVRIWNMNNDTSQWSDIREFKTAASFSSYSTARYDLIESQVKPVSITTIDTDRYLVDFGKDAFGYVQWQIPNLELRIGTASQTMVNISSSQAASIADTTVNFHFGEKLENGIVDRSPGGTIRYYNVPVTLNAQQTEYEVHPPVDSRNTGGSAIKIPDNIGVICPFRYLELVNCPVMPTNESISQVAVFYPFDDSVSSFESDNETLNDIWELCKYSIKATSFAGVYVDGDRERIPYEADAYINQLCHYGVDREFSMARYSHEYLLAHPTWPTEWKQHSIMMAWIDYLYTGNTESLAQNYNTLRESKLLYQYARTDGLLNTGSLQDIVDWPSGERDGYVFKSVNTVVNAFYYHTLLLMEKIAVALDKTTEAQQYSQAAQDVYQAYQSVFYNSQTGLYIDGEGTSHSSLHANMFSLAFGLVPAEKMDTVAEFVISKEMACSVYGAQYLLEALYLAGAEDAAMSLMTSTGSRSWVNMMREGSTITMEAWGISYKSNLDWNHAWGAAPANIIPRFVAGVRPLEPGFAKALIHPQPAALNQFNARIPTIRGTISIDMAKAANSCTFQLDIPANMTAKFVLPKNCDDYANITLDGIAVSIQQDGSLRYIESISSENHTIICQ